MAERLGVELARVGKFELSTGPLNVTPDMLHNATGRGAIKLGHTDPRNDGEPAFGWLENIRAAGDGDQTVLLGDLKDIPAWLNDTADWAYPHRSIEGNVVQAADGTPQLHIDGLALLGVTPPGMPTIASWRDLPKVLVAAAAAGGTDLTASEFRVAFDALTPMAAAAASQTPASPPETHTAQEGVAVSDFDKKVREQLGIAEDLDEAGTLSALTEALAERAEPAPPTADAIAAAFGVPADEVETRLKTTPVAASVPTGMKLVSEDILEQLRINASAGAEARKVQLAAQRDEVIGGHIAAAHITPARKNFWSTKWDLDPEGTQAELAMLGDPVLPVAASGYAGTGESEDDIERIRRDAGFGTES